MQKMDSVNLFLVALGVLGHVASQEVQTTEPTVKEFKNDRNEDGSYSFRFVLSDGTERDEFGYLEADGSLFVSGHYTYIDPNGEKQYVKYYADKTGYHPKFGVPPPKAPFSLPQHIVASLLG